jgi:hypothetical protein
VSTNGKSDSASFCIEFLVIEFGSRLRMPDRVSGSNQEGVLVFELLSLFLHGRVMDGVFSDCVKT